MIALSTSTPLPDAVAQIAGRSPLGSSLSSREWEVVPPEIRLRTMWISRMEQERTVAAAQEKIRQAIEMRRAPDGPHMDRGLFVREMRDELDSIGYRPDPKIKETVMDFSSQKRLGLIWKMNTDQAYGFANWKTGQSKVALRAWPAMEFIRLEGRKEIRPWPEIWAEHGGRFYGSPGKDYPGAPGRMAALKNDGIWTAINRFGVPWKPFDWGSGMGTRNLSRAISLSLGVLSEDDPPQEPQDVPFNRNAQASLAGIPQDRRRVIEDALCGDVEIDGDVIRLLPPEPVPVKFAIPQPVPELAKPIAKARKALSAMKNADVAGAMTGIRQTVAYQRLSHAATATGNALSDTDTVGRALIQFLAMGMGLETVIYSMRREPVRDAWWTDMDFSGIGAFFSGLLGGGS